MIIKNFEEILADNKIHKMNRMYPNRDDIEKCQNKNPGMKIWNGLEDHEKIKLYIIFFKQFFKTVEANDDSWSLILDEKYEFNLRNNERGHYFCLWSNDKVRLSNSRRYSEFDEIQEKPKEINYNLKNHSSLERKIKDYCDYLDKEFVWRKEEKKKEDQLIKDKKQFEVNMTKKLNKLFDCNGNHYFRINDALHLRMNTERQKVELDFSDYSLTNEQIIQIALMVKQMKLTK
jgi:hypothetical protein